MTIDTLKLSRRLTQSGMTQEQADALAAGLREGLSDNFATKDQVRLVQVMCGVNIALTVGVLAALLNLVPIAG